MIEFHPGLILLLGALLVLLFPQKRIRQGIMVLAPSLALLAVFGLKPGTVWTYPFINNMNLMLLKVDDLSLVFAFIFSLIALIGNIYALQVKKSGESAAGLAYAGAALGVVFAGDWVSLIFFWELMAATSVFLIWYRKTRQAIFAGLRYLLVHFLGGNLLLAGILLKVLNGQTEVTALTGTNDAAFWLILFGIAINAAIPPLHAWLTDAYPEATITGSVFLGAFTTKVAVYALVRLFPGTGLLVWAGVIMAFYGIIFALIENDIRRLLAYHIISQVGYMVAAVGMGTALALNGAVAHAFNNILYKSLLFMGVGAVIYATGREKLTELGGLYRKMPVVTSLFMVGALAISGFPLLNGFISKSMVVSAATGHGLPGAELLLYLAGVGTFLCICLKLSYYIFFTPEQGIEVKKVPVNMTVAMGLLAFFCLLYGVRPALMGLPFAAVYEAYTLDHVISTMQLLIAALVGFWFFIPKMGGEATISLDTDWFYRRPMMTLIWGLVGIVRSIQTGSGVLGLKGLDAVFPFFRNPLRGWPAVKGVGDPSVYSENRYRFPVGTIVLATMLVFLVAFSYICFA